MDIEEILRQDDANRTFSYRMLSRLRSDCDYYLGYGNRYSGHLWTKDAKEQIALMKAIWESFSEDKKPEWLTFEQILDYEKQMLAENTSLNEKIQDAAARTAGAPHGSVQKEKPEVTR